MTLISVLVPAYNASATIAETLASARAQSHEDIEILVVDDGSTDGTADIVCDLAAADSRLRLLRQANAGVAAARNTAIDASRGSFIAPLDADDLWHPRKLELQLERFRSGSDRLGLVYNWYRPIDGDGRWCAKAANPMFEGQVLHRHLTWNFIGNGSTPMIRREALGAARYEPGLRAAAAQGCEDYLLQLGLALEWEFACVPAALTGYRQSPAAMSGDSAAMIRSHLQVYRRLRPRVGGRARTICDRRIAHWSVLYASNRLVRQQPGAACLALVRSLSVSPGGAIGALMHQAKTIARKKNNPVPILQGGLFQTLDPWQGNDVYEPSLELVRAAMMDVA